MACLMHWWLVSVISPPQSVFLGTILMVSVDSVLLAVIQPGVLYLAVPVMLAMSHRLELIVLLLIAALSATLGS